LSLFIKRENNNIKKVGVHEAHFQTHGRHPRSLGDATQHPKIPFCQVVESTIMFFPGWTTHVNDDDLVCCWWVFFFLFFSLSSSKSYNSPSFVVGISTSILNLLIYSFCSSLFCRSFIVFNFIFQSQFTKYYILQFDPNSYDFLGL
jgi:hypothetical protein